MNKAIIKKINDLYIINRSKYLILDSDGTYYTCEYHKKRKELNKKGARPLLDYHIEQHLEGKKTLGVFAGCKYTKFICFDVDIKNPVKAKEATWKIIDILIDLGMSEEYIYPSWSGNKGYHVEIFFDKPILNEDAEKFYLIVMNISGLLNIDYGQVELRPTYTQGVKIPLGCNFRNRDWKTQECWYCDLGLNLIKNEDYILQIRKFGKTEFYKILNKNEFDANIETKEIEKFEEVITQYKPLTIYNENIDEETTIESIKKLEKEGLKLQGTRHNSLLKLAKYYRYLGLTKEEAENRLIDWMERQDKNTYTSSWDFVLKDIAEIVKYTYEKGYSLIQNNAEIEVTREEIQDILKVKGKNEKLLLYALLIHSKRYALKDGSFYMTYKQMEEVTGLSERNIYRLIQKLEDANYIQVEHNKDNYIYDKEKKKPISKPNRYKYNLLSDKSYNTKNGNKFTVCNKTCTGCFYACVCGLFNDNEIKQLTSRKQYENIRAYRSYCTKDAI